MSETIGHYDILGVIGSGKMGTVYRARDTRAGRTVALRILDGVPPDPLDRTRIVDSIRPYLQISHPHIAALVEVGDDAGRVFVVHEFVSGDSLSVVMADRPMSLRRAVELALQIADGLAEAHALELIHGALKPDAVFVSSSGRAKVLNFGLAERPGSAGIDRAPFMSPEQVLSEAIDHRTDVFALAGLLHLLATGREPFAGADASEIGLNVMQAKPVAPSLLNPDVPATIDAIVAKGLAKKASDRYQSVAELAADLRMAVEGIRGHDVAPAPPVRRGRGEPAWARLGVLASLLVAAAAVAVWQWFDPLEQFWVGRLRAQPAPVVVVLPFTTSGSETKQPYFGAGIAEDFSVRLGHIPGVTTIGRSSIRNFAGRAPQAVAQDVQASVALTGEIKAGDAGWKTLNITLTLVDRVDGQAIWHRSYNAPATDLVALETRMARDVAERLGVSKIAAAASNRGALRVIDSAAFDTYLQARDALAAQDASRAVQLFEAAITADPSLFEAHAGLAEALSMGSTFEGRLALPDVIARMREVAEDASVADPDAASGYLALGLTAPTLRETLTRLRRAIEIDRSYATAYWHVAELLRDVDPARAMRFTMRVIELDPLSHMARYQLAVGYIALGEFDEALIETARGQALAPTSPWWDVIRARVRAVRPAGGMPPVFAPNTPGADLPPAAMATALSLMADGLAAEATAALTTITRTYPAACDSWAILADVQSDAGNKAEGARLGLLILSQADKSPEPALWARCAAMTAAAIGDADRTAMWIDRAAGSEQVLRLWGATNGIMSPRSAIAQRLLPWRTVVGAPRVAVAVASLDAAYAKARGEASKILDGLLEQTARR
jgi:serine/threonine-protein kinase